MSNIQFFYEIELKSVLDRSQYDRLSQELPQTMPQIGQDIIHTTRYRAVSPDGKYMPRDIRLRHSDKIIEFVYKDGEPTEMCRRELVVPLKSMDSLVHMARSFERKGLVAAPPWKKHKKEFEYDFGGFSYCVCLQDIENFAYILEVEYMSKRDDTALHLPNITAIVESLGLAPCDPNEFAAIIRRYVEANSDQTY